MVLGGLGCAQEAAPETRPPAKPTLGTGCPPNGGQARGPIGSRLPAWDLYLELDAWDALHEDVHADLGVAAALCVERRRVPITLELQGASTRTRPKKSFDVKVTSPGGLPEPFGRMNGGSLRRVLLKAMYSDQSLVREALAFELWRLMGYEAPVVDFVSVSINGAYWGLYATVEPVGRDYLRRHGYRPGGHLYKAVRRGKHQADFAPRRKLERVFEHKTDDQSGGYEDLAALVMRMHETPLSQEAWEREIDPVFSLAMYMDRMIWVSLTQNTDAVAQNFFLYNAPHDGHDHWSIIPWDSNIAFGASRRGIGHTSTPAELLLIDGRNWFGDRLLQVDAFRKAYVERFRNVLAAVLPTELVESVHHELASRVEPELSRDRRRWQRPLSSHEAQQAVLDFVHQRPGHLREALQELARGTD